MESNFYQDLSKEALLGTYLDNYYLDIFKNTSFQVQRVKDIDLQHKGVDLLLKNQQRFYYVDEKAQLDYLHISLPTFAFEISYLKKENWQEGWLLDAHKLTNIYFLITNICPKKEADLNSGLAKIKVIGIYREKLIALLIEKGLHKNRIYELENNIRNNNIDGRISIPEIDAKKEGVFYFSKYNKKEQPINLVLKLDFLLKNRIGKVLFDKKK